MDISVLLVDDHVLVRSAIQTMLEKDPQVKVVGGASTGEEGIEMTRRLKPDVVLMDITMPGITGIEATKQIMAELPDAKVVMLTMHDPTERDVEALHAGAIGYMRKDTDPERFLEAVHLVARGHTLWTQESTRRVLNSLQGAGGNGKTSLSGEALTAREIELLRYLAKGFKTKQIAGELALSESYVRGQLSTLYGKLGVSGAAQAVAYAVEHRLI